MTEKMPPFQSPVENIKSKGPELTAEQVAEAAEHLKDYPEAIVTPEDRPESGPEIAEFEALVTAFEAEHSIEALMAITDLTPSQAAVHPIRQPARAALIPIAAKLNAIEPNVSDATFNELKARYMRLSRAVGVINRNKVDHNR